MIELTRPKMRSKVAPVYTRRSMRILAALWLPSTEEHPIPGRTLRVAFLRQRLTSKKRQMKGFKYNKLQPGKARFDLRHFN